MMNYKQQLINVNVQCGVPEANEIVFNIHITNSASGMVWNVSYRLSQLAALDHDIASNCDVLKDVPFPQIEESVMTRLANKKHFPGKLQELNRYRSLTEEWVFQVIKRCHQMPQLLYELVEDWFCLPSGPPDDWQPGRLLSVVDQSTLAASRNLEGEALLAAINAPPQPAESKGAAKLFTKLFGSKDASKGLKVTVNDPQKQNHDLTLLKIRVQRGQKGRNGKIEYDVCSRFHPRYLSLFP